MRQIEYNIKFNIDSGKVTVSGPIHNLMLYIDIMNQAEAAVLQRLAKEIEAKTSPIIKPDKRLVVPK